MIWIIVFKFSQEFCQKRLTIGWEPKLTKKMRDSPFKCEMGSFLSEN